MKSMTLPLSAAPTGLPILIAATATAGTAIHAGQIKKTHGYDALTLFLQNSHSSAVDASIEITDGTTTRTIVVSLASKAAAVKVLDSWPILEGITVRVFAGTTNVVHAHGSVDQVQSHVLDGNKL